MSNPQAVGAATRCGDEPAVSTVIPPYRRPELLCRAIASMHGQTFGGWRLIVADDNGVGMAAHAAQGVDRSQRHHPTA